MENKTLFEYYKKFKELPPVIITASYDSDIYLLAMDYAIANNEKLTNENISKFFKGNYDVVDESSKSFKTFKKGSK